MDGKTRTCSQCGTVTDTWCPTCVANFPTRRDAEAMSAEERAAEFERLDGPLEIPFKMIHQRIEELVGRPVWTHELGKPELLIQEIRRGTRATLDEVVGKLPSDQPVIVLTDLAGGAA